MFDEIKDNFFHIITSRLTILVLAFCAMGGILLYRCFNLQIVRGEEYLNNFILQNERTRYISSTRGNIYDKDGDLLAYNELAYSVKIEDVFESNSQKNANLNEMIYTLIQMIEKNGDSVITDFRVIIDEDGEFVYSASGVTLQRFLADIYGHSLIGDLTDEERSTTAPELMEYLSRASGRGTRFAIGDYVTEEGSDTRTFVPGMGYSKEDWLKMVTIRYAMNLTSYRKYIGTTVATNVGARTVAVIQENSDVLPGVTIEEDTVRRYVNSEYFAHLLGYTGRISSDELTSLNEQIVAEGGEDGTYTINDVVGKSGIEAYMETTLQGTKGNETVMVDTTGKVRTIIDRVEPESGNDVYLTIDDELTMAAYHIVEQNLAGMVSEKIVNAKEYIPRTNSGSSDITIPIYDVYFAVINNSIVDIRHFSQEDAGEKEAEVYAKQLDYKESVYQRLRQEMSETRTAYNRLSTEYQVYQSNIVSLLRRNGVIMTDVVNEEDATHIAWTTDEVISMGEYLEYCISQNWIDVSRLELDDQYSDSTEVFEALTDYIINMVDNNTELQKRFYKYMLLNDVISGRDICMLLCEQNACEVPLEDEEALYQGRMTAYQFMKNRIDNLDITPAQLALDPCNASVVITDVNTGNVLAMVSYPGYDNNKMANSIDARYYEQLTTDKANPQYNFATQYKAAPGSTFKMVVASAGLMENIISLQDEVSCVGIFTAVDPSPRCWRRSGHGRENVVTAIRDSCNYFFYNLGFQMATRSGTYDETAGLETLTKYADLFGLTEKSGIEITEETPDVSDVDPVRSSIGQGTNSYTTVGIARYITTIANSGNCFDLTLLDQVKDSEGNTLVEYEPKLRNTVDMPQEYWDAIHSGMRQVVENKVYFGDLAVNVAGKTGTAEQVSSRPNHALFTCYAPYEDPEIAMATRIPFGYSSDYAAQLTKDIIRWYYGLATEEELITGTADEIEGGISNEL